jgi:hypothetical protein
MLAQQGCQPRPPPGQVQSGQGRIPGARIEADPGAQFAGDSQALPTVAKKNLLVLKGGWAEGFLEIRLIETAFFVSKFYYHET